LEQCNELPITVNIVLVYTIGIPISSGFFIQEIFMVNFCCARFHRHLVTSVVPSIK